MFVEWHDLVVEIVPELRFLDGRRFRNQQDYRKMEKRLRQAMLDCDFDCYDAVKEEICTAATVWSAGWADEEPQIIMKRAQQQCEDVREKSNSLAARLDSLRGSSTSER